jgi:hypothetical protein
MIRKACLYLMILVTMTACVPSWNHPGDSRRPGERNVLEAMKIQGTEGEAESCGVTFVVPEGWHWFVRGEDLIATRDGVFLQHLFIERIHVDQTDQDILGTFWLVAWSSKKWPTRTVTSLKKRFAPAMSPANAAEVLLESRQNDPSVTGIRVRELSTQTIAGHQAFRLVFDFRLKDSVLEASPLYRSIYCGFMVDRWFYGISYTAALRHYFPRDSQAFETFLESVQLTGK